MAGLMREKAPSADEMRQDEILAESSAEGEEQGNVAPEEQEQYDQWVNNAMDLMYSEQVMPQLLEAMKGDGDPIEGLANALVAVVTRLDDSAGKAGIDVSGDVKMHAGQDQILPLLAELSEAAGIHEYTPEDQEAAFFKALDLYRENQQAQGKLPVEDLKQDMNELAAADEQGRLDEIAPGATEYAQRAGGGQAPAEEEESRGLMRG